jgi:hypothetical protein
MLSNGDVAIALLFSREGGGPLSYPVQIELAQKYLNLPVGSPMFLRDVISQEDVGAQSGNFSVWIEPMGVRMFRGTQIQVQVAEQSQLAEKVQQPATKIILTEQ